MIVSMAQIRRRLGFIKKEDFTDECGEVDLTQIAEFIFNEFEDFEIEIGSEEEEKVFEMVHEKFGE